MADNARSTSEKRKRGRPRKEETVAVRISASNYDSYSRLAIRRNVSLTQVLNEALQAQLYYASRVT